LVIKVLNRQAKFAEPGPIIVHSRDGSFETGVFVAITSLIERLLVENMVDVFRTCRSIAQHRPLVFPKIEQFMFVYDALAEHIRDI